MNYEWFAYGIGFGSYLAVIVCQLLGMRARHKAALHAINEFDRGWQKGHDETKRIYEAHRVASVAIERRWHS